ncbi:MAG: hypothetical protein FWE37_06235 [Spirochaetaceae bacterium]|nr:hypothetical protein [Spirochaetaceae bacterium]
MPNLGPFFEITIYDNAGGRLYHSSDNYDFNLVISRPNLAAKLYAELTLPKEAFIMNLAGKLQVTSLEYGGGQLFKGEIFFAAEQADKIKILAGDSFRAVQKTGSHSLLEGLNLNNLFSSLIKDDMVLEQAKVDDFDGSLEADYALHDKALNLLRRYSNGEAFVEDNLVYLLRPEEGNGIVHELNHHNGLYRVTKNFAGESNPEVQLTICMTGGYLFSSGQLINLTSEEATGLYKVVGFKHYVNNRQALSYAWLKLLN